MATTATRALSIPLGPKKLEVWNVTIGGSDTTATWDTGLDNVDACVGSTTADQSYGGVYTNYSDAGSTVAAGNIHIAGLANSSVLTLIIVGN